MSDSPPTWFLIGSLVVSSLAPTIAFVVASRQVNAALKAARQQSTAAERVGQKNFQGSVVAANRQRWLDELRTDVATFASEVLVAKHKRAAAGSDGFRSVHFAYSRVRMRINSAKVEQKYVVDQMKNIMDNINAPDLTEKLEALMNGVEAVAAGVWRKVKAGD
jgi:hypothetical protein